MILWFLSGVVEADAVFLPMSTHLYDTYLIMYFLFRMFAPFPVIQRLPLKLSSQYLLMMVSLNKGILVCKMYI